VAKLPGGLTFRKVNISFKMKKKGTTESLAYSKAGFESLIDKKIDRYLSTESRKKDPFKMMMELDATDIDKASYEVIVKKLESKCRKLVHLFETQKLLLRGDAFPKSVKDRKAYKGKILNCFRNKRLIIQNGQDELRVVIEFLDTILSVIYIAYNYTGAQRRNMEPPASPAITYGFTYMPNFESEQNHSDDVFLGGGDDHGIPFDDIRFIDLYDDPLITNMDVLRNRFFPDVNSDPAHCSDTMRQRIAAVVNNDRQNVYRMKLYFSNVKTYTNMLLVGTKILEELEAFGNITREK